MSKNTGAKSSRTESDESPTKQYPAKSATVSERRGQVSYTPGQLATIAKAAKRGR